MIRAAALDGSTPRTSVAGFPARERVSTSGVASCPSPGINPKSGVILNLEQQAGEPSDVARGHRVRQPWAALVSEPDGRKALPTHSRADSGAPGGPCGARETDHPPPRAGLPRDLRALPRPAARRVQDHERRADVHD